MLSKNRVCVSCIWAWCVCVQSIQQVLSALEREVELMNIGKVYLVSALESNVQYVYKSTSVVFGDGMEHLRVVNLFQTFLHFEIPLGITPVEPDLRFTFSIESVYQFIGQPNESLKFCFASLPRG